MGRALKIASTTLKTTMLSRNRPITPCAVLCGRMLINLSNTAETTAKARFVTIPADATIIRSLFERRKLLKLTGTGFAQPNIKPACEK